jgi:hypothetical protein
MHEPHLMFDSTENQLVVSISPPLAHHLCIFSHTFPLYFLSTSSTESKVRYLSMVSLLFSFHLLSHPIESSLYPAFLVVLTIYTEH